MEYKPIRQKVFKKFPYDVSLKICHEKKSNLFFLFLGIPRDISFTVVQETFNSVEGIVAVHNLRIWGLTTDKTALAAHLVIGKFVNLTSVLSISLLF